MIRGTKRPMAPTAKQTLDLRASIHNRFDIEVRDAATGELKQRARGYNVICEALWDRVLHVNSYNNWKVSGYFNYILFGSGSGTPSASDTTLFSLLGAKSVSSALYENDVPAGIVYRQNSIVLNAEEYVGDTLTEVGIGYSSTNIVTHAMLQDMNGNPISIEKTATDVIIIYATVYLHFASGGWYGGSVMMAPPDRSTTGRFYAYLLGGNNGGTSIDAFARPGAGKRTGNFTSGFSLILPSVDRANKKLSFTSRMSASELNLPIRSVPIYCGESNSRDNPGSHTFWLTPGSWFSPPAINGEAVGTGDGTTTGFSTAFPVKTAGTVYVDGVAASGVTMRAGPADAARMEYWMNACEPNVGVKVYSNSAYSITASGLEIAVAAGEKSYPLENPFYSLGIQKVRKSNGNYSNYECTVLASDDLTNWSVVGTIPAASGFAELSVPAALRNKRYWQIQAPANASAHYFVQFVADAADTAHNIVFETPPAAGAVITADYTPDCIAKDENHVFDLSMVLTLGEYQEV